MASNGQVNVSSQEEVREVGQEVREAEELREAGQENVLRRVASMPLISSTYDIAATAYSSAKDSHPYVTSLFDVAEKGVKTLTEVAVNTAQPILNKLEPQIATANEYASKGLDTLEEKLPILQLTADEIASSTKEMVSTTVASAKEAIANKISGVVDMTREVISHSVSNVVESRVGQIAVSGAEAVLDSAEEMIDDYLPMTDEELAELAAAVKNGGDLVAVQHSEQEEYLVRLGSLTAKLRNRAYRHSVEKLKRARQRIQDSLFQLEQTIRLLEYMKNEAGQKLSEHQEKLRQMVLEWSKAHVTDDKVEACVCARVDLQTITMIQSMIQQLQATFQPLISSIQGFPSGLQDKVHQIRQSTRELHASLSGTSSLQELSNTLLAQSYQTVKKAQEYMEELRQYITHHTPLSWLVGPFTLPAKQPAEAAEPGEPKELD